MKFPNGCEVRLIKKFAADSLEEGSIDVERELRRNLDLVEAVFVPVILEHGAEVLASENC